MNDSDDETDLDVTPDHYCPRCRHFDSVYGACTRLQFNAAGTPEYFQDYCRGKLFSPVSGNSDSE